jgi:hypothetical protein
MQLADLIDHLESEEDAGNALMAIGDLVLFAQVVAMGKRFDESPAAYTAGAVARFAAGASDEDWLTLIGALERAQEPRQAFLLQALKWALTRDASGHNDAPCCGTCATGNNPELHHGGGP